MAGMHPAGQVQRIEMMASLTMRGASPASSTTCLVGGILHPRAVDRAAKGQTARGQTAKGQAAPHLTSVQGFLQKLVKRAQGGQGRQAAAGVAVRCLCMLLTALLHFNYAGDLLQVRLPVPCFRLTCRV